MIRKCIFAKYSGYVEYEQNVMKVFSINEKHNSLFPVRNTSQVRGIIAKYRQQNGKVNVKIIDFFPSLPILTCKEIHYLSEKVTFMQQQRNEKKMIKKIIDNRTTKPFP